METIHTEKYKGFDISLSVAPEDYAPDWDFETEEEKQKLLNDIENGNVEWFMAKVTASKNGIGLGSDHLGGCCYKSVEDFINPDCYYGDMRNQAVKEAKEAIKSLTE